MSKEYKFKLVDAFAMSPYSGNVAGVVMAAEGLSDRQMQAIATEFNAAETTFVLSPTTRDAAVRFRWFTPGCEVDFCGHATLGAAHALFEDGRFTNAVREPGTIVPIETKAGILTLRTESHPDDSFPYTIWLDMPHCEPKKRSVPLPNYAKYLGLSLEAIDPALPSIRTQDNDIMLAVKDLQTLLELQPSMADLSRYCIKEGVRGVFVTTTNALSKATVVQSRFFAPAVGIDEDPVTGSAHGPLGLHLVESGIVSLEDGRADFFCAQGKGGGRAGVVRVVVKVEGDSKHVRIGGSCITTAEGTLKTLPKS